MASDSDLRPRTSPSTGRRRSRTARTASHAAAVPDRGRGAAPRGAPRPASGSARASAARSRAGGRRSRRVPRCGCGLGAPRRGRGPAAARTARSAPPTPTSAASTASSAKCIWSRSTLRTRKTAMPVMTSTDAGQHPDERAAPAVADDRAERPGARAALPAAALLLVGLPPDQRGTDQRDPEAAGHPAVEHAGQRADADREADAHREQAAGLLRLLAADLASARVDRVLAARTPRAGRRRARRRRRRPRAARTPSAPTGP